MNGVGVCFLLFGHADRRSRGMGGYCSSCMFSLKIHLILDYAVGRNDGSTYSESVGFQSNPLVKNACTVDNGRCKCNQPILDIILESRLETNHLHDNLKNPFISNRLSLSSEFSVSSFVNCHLRDPNQVRRNSLHSIATSMSLTLSHPRHF